MNIIIAIAVAICLFLLVATICCIMAVLNPPKEYMSAAGGEEEMLSVKREKPYENRIAGICIDSRHLYRFFSMEQDCLPPLAQAL